MKHLLLVLSLVGLQLDAAACNDTTGTGKSAKKKPLTDKNRADEKLELDGMVFHDTCSRVTPSACQRCLQEVHRVQNECRDACNTDAFISGQFAFNCADRCSRSSASELCEHECNNDEPEQCERRSLRFELTAKVQPQNEAACDAAVAREFECDETIVGDRCSLYGRVESPDVIPSYECLAQRPCGDAPEDCLELLPTGNLVQRLSESCHSEIDPAVLQRLEIQQHWVLPELQDNALVCAERYCGVKAYSTCLAAWNETTFGE